MCRVSMYSQTLYLYLILCPIQAHVRIDAHTQRYMQRVDTERKYNHDYHLIDIFGYFWVCCTQTKTHNTHTRDAYDDDDVYGSSCGCKGA